MKTLWQTTQATSNRRSGATLTEVLMSLMIMGIGVSALASLFPIAVIRSIEATKLTHATNLRLNAEGMLGVYSHVADGGFTWRPNISFSVGDTVVPPDANGCVYIATATSGPTAAFAPAWPEIKGNTVGDGGVTWQCVAGRNPSLVGVVTDQTSKYVIDPLGFAIQSGAAIQGVFGNDGALPAAAMPVATQLPRLSVGFGTAAAADSLVSLPDSWVIDDTTIEATIGGTVANPTIAMPATIDLNMLQTTVQTSGTAVRLVLMSADRKQSQVRVISDPATINPAPAIYDITLQSPLPATPNFATLSEVRIESQQRRYSWLMTVRRPIAEESDPSVDLVVFFNRSLTAEDETIYPAHFTTVVNGTQQPNQVNVDWTASPAKPFMKKGGYVFDAENAYWYRITQVDETSGTTATLTIDRAAKDTSLDVAGIGTASTPAAPTGGAIFMRGIIEVFPLGSL